MMHGSSLSFLMNVINAHIAQVNQTGDINNHDCLALAKSLFRAKFSRNKRCRCLCRI